MCRLVDVACGCAALSSSVKALTLTSGVQLYCSAQFMGSCNDLREGADSLNRWTTFLSRADSLNRCTTFLTCSFRFQIRADGCLELAETLRKSFAMHFGRNIRLSRSTPSKHHGLVFSLALACCTFVVMPPSGAAQICDPLCDVYCGWGHDFTMTRVVYVSLLCCGCSHPCLQVGQGHGLWNDSFCTRTQ